MADENLREYYRGLLKNPNIQTSLYIIRKAEGTEKTGNPYGTGFGGRQFDYNQGRPTTQYPFRQNNGVMNRTSAHGAYQEINKTAAGLNEVLGNDFSPESQDMRALHLIKQRGGLDAAINGDFATFAHKTRKEWASLPNAGYNQNTRSTKDIQKYAEEGRQKYGGSPRDYAEAGKAMPPSNDRSKTTRGNVSPGMGANDQNDSMEHPMLTPESQDSNPYMKIWKDILSRREASNGQPPVGQPREMTRTRPPAAPAARPPIPPAAATPDNRIPIEFPLDENIPQDFRQAPAPATPDNPNMRDSQWLNEPPPDQFPMEHPMLTPGSQDGNQQLDPSLQQTLQDPNQQPALGAEFFSLPPSLQEDPMQQPEDGSTPSQRLRNTFGRY